MAGYRESRMRVDGCNTVLRRGGNGPPLLFLHGAGGFGIWGDFHDRLASRFDVLAPSHPGFDGSDDPPWLDRVADLGHFYLDLMQALGLEQVHLVGHSLGGWLAAEIATRDTRRLASVTLMCAAGIHVEGIAQLDTFLLAPDERVRRQFVDKAKAESLAARVSDPANLDLVLKNQETAARLAWQPRLYDPHLRKWLHRIDRPTLVLWGDSDPIFPAAYAEAYGRLIPGAKAVVIERCGHQPNVEHPAETATAITTFIEGLSA
ncbi:MAG: alpha/beta hydrolase [Hyphomicrobiaceae bacterium]|nr:alpha/beta hydrolase [Hyphomicrobiaceae bacterium]